MCIIEGSLEVKLPTIWRDEKAVSREKSQKRKDQKKEDAGARKGRKVAKHCVFMLKKCTELRREAHLEVKSVKNWWSRSTFGCRKNARRCGAKYISKLKVLKIEGLGDILDVQTSFCVAGGVDCASTEK